MKTRVIIVTMATLVLCSCVAPLKDKPPEGWPELMRIERINVDEAEVAAACNTNPPVYACTVVNLCERTCRQSFKAGSYTPEIRAHEVAHCAGRDHWFSSVLANLLERWKRGKACTGSVTPKDHAAADAALMLFLLF